MSVKQIVVGVDFSAESFQVAKKALSIARHIGANLVLVHVGVVPESPPLHESVHPSIREWEGLLKAQLAEDREQLATMREHLRGQGVEISHVVRDGFADIGLTDTARELDADLLVVGTQGRTGLKRFFLGSLSERIVRLSTTNVMVARPADGGNNGYRRILVPTDFSAAAEEAVRLARDLASADAVIDLVHFWQLPMTATMPYPPFKAAEEIFTAMRQTLSEAARHSGQKLLDRYRQGDNGADNTLTFNVIELAPIPGIQRQLEAGDYDLVVMGSHGRRGPRRFLLGSVAEATVRHAPCSVLVAHKTDSDAKRATGEQPAQSDSRSANQRSTITLLASLWHPHVAAQSDSATDNSQ